MAKISEIKQQCVAEIPLPKRLQGKVDSRCHNLTFIICTHCGNPVCHRHLIPSNHDCESLEKGVIA